MSLCPHGYTSNFDCPECECAGGCGETAANCRCEELERQRERDERLDDPRRGQAKHINRNPWRG